MTPDQIAQLRTRLQKIFAIADNEEPYDYHGYPEIKKLADEALALLPCETCNGTGVKYCTPKGGNTTVVKGFNLPCSDCK